MCNVMVIDATTRHHIARKEGNTVFYAKQTKAEKDYLKQCERMIKHLERVRLGK